MAYWHGRSVRWCHRCSAINICIQVFLFCSVCSRPQTKWSRGEADSISCIYCIKISHVSNNLCKMLPQNEHTLHEKQVKHKSLRIFVAIFVIQACIIIIGGILCSFQGQELTVDVFPGQPLFVYVRSCFTESVITFSIWIWVNLSPDLSSNHQYGWCVAAILVSVTLHVFNRLNRWASSLHWSMLRSSTTAGLLRSSHSSPAGSTNG